MKKNVRRKPPLAPKEKFGMLLIVLLCIAESILCISILSGAIDTQFIYRLDISGQWAVDAIRWSNASVEYRDLMIPVYISIHVYMLIIVVVTIATRDWNNIVEWESNIGIGVTILTLLMGLFIYYIFNHSMGMDEIIYDVNELSKVYERPMFTNKFSFIMHSFFMTCFAYEMVNFTAIFIIKIKKQISK